MGDHGHGRQWAREFESRFGNRPGGSWGGKWSDGPAGSNRPSGPPPWLAGLFGLAQGSDPQQRGPRVRRGDVRAAILDVLATEPMNGYQVIQQIAERSGGVWRPSPGSVYPTIQQLEDEGLIESDDAAGRRTLRLSETGQTYVAEHPDELAEVWAPFDRGHRSRRGSEGGPDYAALKPEIGQVMNAVWQIITTGSDQQRRDAIGVLIETRRRLYNILAEGDPVEDETEPADAAADPVEPADEGADS